MVQLLKVPTSVGLAAPCASAPAAVESARAALRRNRVWVMVAILIPCLALRRNPGGPEATALPPQISVLWLPKRQHEQPAGRLARAVRRGFFQENGRDCGLGRLQAASSVFSASARRAASRCSSLMELAHRGDRRQQDRGVVEKAEPENEVRDEVEAAPRNRRARRPASAGRRAASSGRAWRNRRPPPPR